MFPQTVNVIAYDKLCRGEFSASLRVYTFVSTATCSRYQVSARHIAGAAILPSDYSSRNSAKCKEATCQICSFVSQSIESVVHTTSLSDIIAIHHEICMVNHTARVTRPKEDVRAYPPGNTLLSEDNKHKRYQTLPQWRNQSI